MKNYNRWVFLSLMLYLAAATAVAVGTYQSKTKVRKEYKVEINRLYDSLSQGLPLDKLSLHSCTYVTKVEILSASDSYNKEKVTEFYEEGNVQRMEIRPLFVKGKQEGYARFLYEEPGVNLYNAVFGAELGLAVMELFCLLLLFFVKRQILRPFERMKGLPYEMAKGHLHNEVKEEHNQFFGKFVWGLGLLQDTLDVSKKRSLELEKEKKLLLLSLSHDIKTPLNTIKLYGKALSEDLYEEETKKKHAAIQIGVKALEIEHYVEEIMKNSREDILDIQVEKGEFYLKDLLDKLLCTHQEKCTIRMIELQVNAYENRLMYGDLERTQEVFDNLFENAVKYGDGRRIELSFYEEDYRQLIRIYNTGVPVNDTEFSHIFESFFRAGNSEGKQGNGLGLYICREIMGKMGGEIFAEKDKEGMAFILVFR